MNPIQLVERIYAELSAKIQQGVIPVALRAPSLIGTVQDDPFDFWLGNEIRQALPNVEVVHAGKLTTPDIVLRHKPSNSILGLEVKKLIQQTNGKDPRGLTIDYNSCLPCGKALVKVGQDTVEVPCFYLFALLSNDSSSIVTSILMDGDFLNYDFALHKDAKYANQSEYDHGPYGEGSVRHRRMYTNSFLYAVIDNSTGHSLHLDQLPVRQDIFRACKSRRPKDRTASMLQLSE